MKARTINIKLDLNEHTYVVKGGGNNAKTREADGCLSNGGEDKIDPVER